MKPTEPEYNRQRAQKALNEHRKNNITTRVVLNQIELIATDKMKRQYNAGNPIRIVKLNMN